MLSALEEIRTPNLLIRSYLALSAVLGGVFAGHQRARAEHLDGVKTLITGGNEPRVVVWLLVWRHGRLRLRLMRANSRAYALL